MQRSHDSESVESSVYGGLLARIHPTSYTPYGLDYADTLNENDIVFEDFGVKVIVMEGDLEFVNGIELDYRREGINEAFQFNNPNVKGTCGCGESFSVG